MTKILKCTKISQNTAFISLWGKGFRLFGVGHILFFPFFIISINAFLVKVFFFKDENG